MPVTNAYWSQDSAVSTPYAHVLDFSIARELRNGASFELSYVGRLAHHLLEQEDVAMPTNLSAAGTSYFAAARQMARLTRANGGLGVPISSVQPIPYWQTLFGALDGQDIGFGPGFTAAQNIYQLYQQNIFNEANSLYALDMPDSNTGPGINPNGLYPSNRFFHDQFSALYAWRSIGNSNYNALQAVYRPALRPGPAGRLQLHLLQIARRYLAGRAARHLGKYQLRTDHQYLESQPALWPLGFRSAPPDERQLPLGPALWPRQALRLIGQQAR